MSSITPTHDMHELSSGVTLHALHWEPVGPPSGPTWVLTHGLASNARLWDDAAALLAAAGHRVVTVDQRGHGQSSKPDDGYDVATCADDLALLISELNLDRPAVAGQSWGGNVVLELGRRHSDIVSLICCVDGGFIDLQSRFAEWNDCAEALAPPKLAGTPLDTMRGWLERSAGDWPPAGRAGTLANFEVLDDNTIRPWLTFERHLTVLRGLWEHQPSATYPHVDLPALLIVAETGEVNWTDSKSDAARHAVVTLPTGRAHWFSPAHHDVHAQHPALVAELLHSAVTSADFFDTAYSSTDTHTGMTTNTEPPQ